MSGRFRRRAVAHSNQQGVETGRHPRLISPAGGSRLRRWESVEADCGIALWRGAEEGTGRIRMFSYSAPTSNGLGEVEGGGPMVHPSTTFWAIVFRIASSFARTLRSQRSGTSDELGIWPTPLSSRVLKFICLAAIGERFLGECRVYFHPHLSPSATHMGASFRRSGEYAVGSSLSSSHAWLTRGKVADGSQPVVLRARRENR